MTQTESNRGVLTDNSNDYFAENTIEGNGNYEIFNEISEDINGLVTNEKTRLAAKETQVNELYDTHTRMKHFKSSASKRKNAYWRMFMVIVFLSIIIVLLFIFRNNFPLVPSWAMDLILMVVIAGGFIYMFTIYEDIIKRDLTDYDKLDPESPLVARHEREEEAQEHLDKGEISRAISSQARDDYCQGRNCCTSGTYFDLETGKCTESFQTYKPFKPLDSFTEI